MSTDRTLSELRTEFGQSRMLAMPIAGTIVWSAAAAFGVFLAQDSAAIALFICLGTVFPVGIIVARLTGEDLFGTKNPKKNDLEALFGWNILMANLVWGIAIPFWLVEPSSLPLSLGILAGLVWVPLSWMIQHWVGLFHAIARTILVVIAWFVFPADRFVVIPVIVVVVYVISIVVLATRRLPESASPTGC